MEGAKQGSNNAKREVEPESYKPTRSEAVRTPATFPQATERDDEARSTGLAP